MKVNAYPGQLEGTLTVNVSYTQVLNTAICLLAAALPNDAVLGGFDPVTGTGFRSPSYYVGIVAALMAIPRVPFLIGLVTKSKPLLLMIGATLVPFVVLLAQVLEGRTRWMPQYQVDRPFKAILASLLFLSLAVRPDWRAKLLRSYLMGWAVFVAIAIYQLASGRAELSDSFGASRLSVLGMNENVQSLTAASGLVLLLGGLADRRRPSQVAWALLGLIGGGFVFLVGASRTALASLLAAILVLSIGFFGANIRHRGKAITRIVFVSLAVVSVGLWLSGAFQTVADSLDAMHARSVSALIGDERGSRDTLLGATIDIAIDNPGGIGMGRTLDYLGMDPHNGYAKVLAEGGFLALGLLCSALFWAVAISARMMRSSANIGPVAAFTLYSVSALSGQALVESTFWLFFAFVALPMPRTQNLTGSIGLTLREAR